MLKILLILFNERISSRYFLCKLSEMRGTDGPMDKEEPPLSPIYGHAGGCHPAVVRPFLRFLANLHCSWQVRPIYAFYRKVWIICNIQFRCFYFLFNYVIYC
jgi:hypothetical protein